MHLKFKTPAKINLGLKILRKRDDGFHELETIFQMVSWFDDIELSPLDQGIELECNAPEIPTDESNLVFKAALLLKESYPDTPGVHIKLIKSIPSGAGLAGGSGNAAGTLLALNRMWDLRLSPEQLQPFAEKLGSDVPFFLYSPCALGCGRGEKLTSLQTPKKFKVLLVSPNFSIPTGAVYSRLNLKLTTDQNHISILQKFISNADLPGLGARLFNDLERVVVESHRIIGEIKEEMRRLGACGSLLSGSGSTVFAIFDDAQTAQTALESFPKGEWSVRLSETVEHFSEFLPDEILNYP